MFFLFFYLLLVFLLVSFLLSLSFLWLESSIQFNSLSSYECGFEPIGHAYSRFCMKFFLLAIIYIVFDIEVAILVPGVYSSSLVLSFVIILLLGLFYEFIFGGLDWVA